MAQPDANLGELIALPEMHHTDNTRLEAFSDAALGYLHAARGGRRVGLTAVQTSEARDRVGGVPVVPLLGIVSAGFAMADAGVRYGVPGWMYVINGPALSLCWVWRHRKQAPAAPTTGTYSNAE
jgi:hypothetical protein